MDDQNEMFVVVDRNDNVINFRSRRDCHRDSSLIHRASKIALFSDRDHIWLQKRSQNKDLNPGMLTLSASGHVKPRESYKNAIIREMKEEIGINIPVEFVAKFLHEPSHESEYISLYRGFYNGEFIINPLEVESMFECPIADLDSQIPHLTKSSIISLQKLKLL